MVNACSRGTLHDPPRNAPSWLGDRSDPYRAPSNPAGRSKWQNRGSLEILAPARNGLREHWERRATVIFGVSSACDRELVKACGGSQGIPLLNTAARWIYTDNIGRVLHRPRRSVRRRQGEGLSTWMCCRQHLSFPPGEIRRVHHASEQRSDRSVLSIWIPADDPRWSAIRRLSDG